MQVTPAVFRGIAAGLAASSVLCRANGSHLLLVDVGVDHDVSAVTGKAASSDGCSITVRHEKVRLFPSPLGPA
jgi:hypothetical protein